MVFRLGKHNFEKIEKKSDEEDLIEYDINDEALKKMLQMAYEYHKNEELKSLLLNIDLVLEKDHHNQTAMNAKRVVTSKLAVK
jgi:N-acetylglucosamine-6-phosphate deacetylase